MLHSESFKGPAPPRNTTNQVCTWLVNYLHLHLHILHGDEITSSLKHRNLHKAQPQADHNCRPTGSVVPAIPKHVWIWLVNYIHLHLKLQKSEGRSHNSHAAAHAQTGATCKHVLCRVLCSAITPCGCHVLSHPQVGVRDEQGC